MVTKPNRRITEAEKQAGEKRAAQAAGEGNKPEAASGLGRVFSFLRSEE